MPQTKTYAMLPGVNSLSIYHLGPPLSAGPLPTLIYLALSGPESLQLDPFDQPARYAAEKGWRVLSFTLPGHGPGFINTAAMAFWAQEIQNGRDFLAPFLEQALENIHFLVQQNVINSASLAASGLSRGGFVALHLAARDPLITSIISFASLTQLIQLKEFRPLAKNTSINDWLEQWNLKNQLQALVGKRIRFCIGNRDIRVGTEACFELSQALTEANFLAGHRSPPVEFVMVPSIGAQGHGTSQATFHAAIDWLIK